MPSSELDTFARFCAQHLRLEDGRSPTLEPFQRRMLADYFDGATETLILVGKILFGQSAGFVRRSD